MSDLVAVWEVSLSDHLHKIEFEHGTASGKRVIRVDGKEVFRKDWMFKLVGSQIFNIGNSRCIIDIKAVSGFMYEYTLRVNGKELQKFMENQSKIMRIWKPYINDTPMRIVLERDTLDIWVNGEKIEASAEFVEDGTETHFKLGSHDACIKAVSTGNKREGIIHSLIVDDVIMPEFKE